MHQHDYFNEDELRAAIPGQDPNLIELIDQLKNWNFTEDDAHLERRPDSLTMRFYFRLKKERYL
jgi:hypothetical protein